MQILSTRHLLETPVFGVDELTVLDDAGIRRKRSVVTHAGSAVVLPMQEDGSVLLVSQWRAPIRSAIWELPAGRIDEGETPLRAAKRELAEETGLRARKWQSLGRLHPTPGYVAERMHLYLATGLDLAKASPEEDEQLELRWFSRAELEAYLDRGRLTDGKTVAGLLLAWRRMPR